jgi:hypothetical protein
VAYPSTGKLTEELLTNNLPELFSYQALTMEWVKKALVLPTGNFLDDSIVTNQGTPLMLY